MQSTRANGGRNPRSTVRDIPSKVKEQGKKELEGRGALAKALDYTANNIQFVSTGTGPSVRGTPIGEAQHQAAKKGRGGNLPGATITAQKAYNTAAGRVVKDAITFPAQAIPSVYVPAAGVKEAAQGHPQRLKKFAKDFAKNDPVYNLGAAGVAAAKGDSSKAKNHLKNFEHAASQHPGLTALEFSGVKGGVGRAAGSTMRSGVLGKAAKGAASTSRASRAVSDTRIIEKRQYSRDVTKKAAQVAVEKSKRRQRDKLNQRATVALKAGKVDEARALRRRAADVDPDRLRESEIKRRVDERVSANEDIRRTNRARVVKQTKAILKPAHREAEAVSLVSQRIAKSNRADLSKLADELEAERGGLSTAKKRANKDLVRAIRKVVDDPKADLGRVDEVAAKYAELTKPMQNKLVKYGMLDKAQAERARLTPYAVRNMGAEHVVRRVVDETGKTRVERKLMLPTEKKAGLQQAERDVVQARKAYKAVKDEGNRDALNEAKARLETTGAAAYRDFTNEEVKAHMAANGVEKPAFVTQAPNMNSARSFNVRSERAPKASPGKRTGEATRGGTFDASQEALVANAAHMQGLSDAARGFRQIIKETGHRQGGKLQTFKSFSKANDAAKNLLHDPTGEPIPGQHEFVPVRLNALGAPKAQLENLLEDVNMEHSVRSQMIAAAEGRGGSGDWALVPRAAMDRLTEHLNRQGGTAGAKSFQLVNQAFRRTVLSTSTAWFAGNTIEGLGRAALSRSGPGSYLFARKTLGRLQEINPKAAEEAMHRIVGGGHYSLSTRGHIRRGAESFEGTKLAGLATALGKFWRAPGPKQAAHLWGAYTDLVFHRINGTLESSIQMAMLGRAMKNSDIMESGLLKSGKKAVDEAALGMVGTENQVMFGRLVDQMYGKYSKFSPSMRHYLSMYTPFAAWAVNAAYFVYRTLPRDHPVATAVIASAEQATDEWRKTQGLDQFMGAGALPGFLQGQIPEAGGKHFRLTRYTPFGAFSDFPESYANQVLPVLSGVLAALKGEDWKGKKLTVKDPKTGKSREADPIERLVFGAMAFIDATVPIKYQAQRVLQDPNNLNPLRSIAPATAKKKKTVSLPKASFNTGGGAKWSDKGSSASWTTP